MIGDGFGLKEFWIVSKFDSEADWKPKSGCVGEINRSRREQANFIDRQNLAQINLHPLDRVSIFLNVAVVTVAWALFILRESLAELLSRSEEHTSELQSRVDISYAV